ncbi:MAG TPA: hypothetical protein VHH36_09075 [Candidatus Thermoplasmatota archaeon]|nr:hypothetical protein [Candidatus Thermoplasmatota archaeon]
MLLRIGLAALLLLAAASVAAPPAAAGPLCGTGVTGCVCVDTTYQTCKDESGVECIASVRVLPSGNWVGVVCRAD